MIDARTLRSDPIDELPAEYDPLDRATWPVEQLSFALEVWQALYDGNMKPLAAYLRAGHCIDPLLASAIADTIEQQRKPGQRGLTQLFMEHARKMQIAVFMEERLSHYGKGGYEAALKDTCSEFNIGSGATVAKARKHLAEFMNSAPTAGLPGREDWELFQAVHRFYSTR